MIRRVKNKIISDSESDDGNEIDVSMRSAINDSTNSTESEQNTVEEDDSSVSSDQTDDDISFVSSHHVSDQDNSNGSKHKKTINEEDSIETVEEVSTASSQHTDDDIDVSMINSSNDSKSFRNNSINLKQFISDVGTTKSLPPEFMKPLARSSILPVPTSIFLKPKSLATTTKFLTIPSALLKPKTNNAKSREEIIDLESSIIDLESSDDSKDKSSESANIIEESFDELKAKMGPQTLAIAETSESSVSSASGTSNLSDRKGSLPHLTSSTSDNNFSGSSQRSGSCNSSTESQSEMKELKRQLEEKSLAYRHLVYAQKNCDPRKLKDGGLILNEKVNRCRIELEQLQKKFNNLSSSLKDDDIEIVATVKKDIIFSTRDQNTAHLGQKAMETHRIEKALTMDALVSLHSSLATTPSLDAMEEPPSGLNVPLMPHQRQALSWLLHREKQNPPGGILADDMGLGKTLTMIALVMRSTELRKDDSSELPTPWRSKVSGPGHPGKTLVVCPASLVGQWESQVKQHVRRGKVSTLIHHGTNREGRGSQLVQFDLVITTYGVISQENKAKVGVFRVAWDRVILDEAHAIRNHKTQGAVAACELNAKHRWCLTGTPVHNKELDIYSLLKFLRCAPFDDIMVWKRWVDNKTPAGTERLNTVVKSILLRRTKEELKAEGGLIDLATKEIHSIKVELDEQEFKVYENVMNFSKTLVAQYLQQRAEKIDGGLMAPRIQELQLKMKEVGDVKTHDILVLLLRLRQICCLPGLISAMLEEDTTVTDGIDKEDGVVDDLFKHMRRLTITKPIPDEEPSVDVDKVLLTSNPVFRISRPSTKMRTLMETLKDIVDKNEKVVVVSQWAGFLRHLDTHLKQLGVKIGTLDGSVPVKNRGPLVDQFNDPKSSLKVLLLSLTAGGVGLNLIGGNHLVIMEPHWNPQLESQACDRVYRVGQKKPVHIYKFISKDTIEERIELLQQKKLQLAENVLTGQLKKEVNKLSLQDIKSLFGLDGS